MTEKDTLNMSLNITNIRGAFVRSLKGRSESKPCVIIPIDEQTMFVGEKGIYIDLVAFPLKEEHKNGDNDERTHSIKQSFRKEFRESLSEDERKAIPFIGNVSVFKRENVATQAAAMPPMEMMPNDNDDDLPF